MPRRGKYRVDRKLKAGGKSSLTKEIHDKIVLCIRNGQKPTWAYKNAGINPKTWHAWKTRAETGREPYRRLFDAIEQADADAVLRVSNALFVNAVQEKDTRAQIAWLERFHPEDFSSKQSDYKVEVVSNDEQRELKERLAALLDRRGQQTED